VAARWLSLETDWKGMSGGMPGTTVCGIRRAKRPQDDQAVPDPDREESGQPTTPLRVTVTAMAPEAMP
jgi:hypothetical protein